MVSSSLTFRFLLSLFLVNVSCIYGNTVPATSPLILWQGRTLINSTENSVNFDWLGVQASFVVTGSTTVSAVFRSTFLSQPQGILDSPSRQLQSSTFPKFGMFHVYVNGNKTNTLTLFPSGPTCMMLATDLNPSSTYNITLWYLTDPVYNTWPNLLCLGCYQSILSFTTDGTLMTGIPRNRRLLIIGDSITSGNGLISPCPKSPNATSNDHSISYGALLCDDFEANCTTLSVSSKGIYVNCCDNYNTTVKDFALRTLAQDPSSVYDWSNAPPPSAIMINLGTNDSGHENSPQWITNFVNTYVDFVRNLTEFTGGNNQLPFFFGVGPITNRYLPWVTTAQEILNTTYQITNTYLINYTGATLDGCGHPGVKGHQEMYEIARPIISQVMNWN